MLEGEVAVGGHFHSVHEELDVADLNVVADAGSDPHHLAFLCEAGDKVCGERQGRRETKGIVGQVVDDLKSTGSVGDIGQTVVDRDGRRVARNVERGDELVG